MGINYAKEYVALLDEKFTLESKSSVLDTGDEFVRTIVGAPAQSVYICERTFSGLGNYNRATGYVAGAVDNEWVEYKLTQDRGRKFFFDEMDNLETAGTLFANFAGAFIKEKVAPEADAYRFSKYFQGAGTKAYADLSASTSVSALSNALTGMEEAEVPVEGCYIFMTPTVYGYVQQDSAFDRNLAPAESPDRNFATFDSKPVVKVPQTRFYTKITLKDGVTSGQTEGGYVKHATEGFNINFMIIHPASVAQVVKHEVPRIFAPRDGMGMPVNPDANAWRFDYRVYHDAFVMHNKTSGIYAHAEANAEPEGD